MSHASGEAFCVMPGCMVTPDERIEQPLCASHAISVYMEVKAFASRHPIRQHAKRPGRNTLNEPGSVYFMDIDGLIKIGFSTNVPQRAKQLGGTVLATMAGTRKVERQMHARYGHLWIEGEYFQPDPELMAEIERLRVSDLT